MASNLPPGCSSADGGINHAYEAVEEKALDMANEAGLDTEELLYAMRVGIEAVKLMRPIVAEAVKTGDGCEICNPDFAKELASE